MDEITCCFCKEPVDVNSRSTWHEVSGFERIAGVRSSGKHGGSDVALRQVVVDGKLAHDHCVQLERDGVSRDQVALELPDNQGTLLPSA